MHPVHDRHIEPDTPAAICRGWLDCGVSEIAPLPGSGFSGSQVMLVRSADRGSFVLKSFHSGASRQHAAWVHRLAGHLRGCGIDQIPDVMLARTGDTVVEADGKLWELCRFMPGVAVPCPAPAQAATAGEFLARLHLAAATLPGVAAREAPSPGVARRIEQARRLEALPWPWLRSEVRREHGRPGMDHDALVTDVARRLDTAIDLFTAADGPRTIARLARLASLPSPVQPVLRDVWCEHLLYASATSIEITGVVDLHAAGIDTPATDIARLLGSWGVSGECVLRSPVDRHPAAIAAYERLRPLTPPERRLIAFLHSSAVIFGLDNWFRWVLAERRRFPAPLRVLDRIDRLMWELQPAIATAADTAHGIVD